MSLAVFLHSLGSSGMFGARAFSPALLTALFLRYGERLGEAHSAFLPELSGVPVWFTSDWMIGTLALLTLLELTADKVPESRDLLNGFGEYLKPTMAAVTTMGLLSSTDAAVVEELALEAGLGDLLATGFVASTVWFVAHTRSLVFGWLAESDPDDDIGVQRLLSWAEDAWATFGLLFLFLFPIAMFLAVCAVFGVLFLLRRRADAREERSRVPCASCAALTYRTALQCASCAADTATPSEVGLFGQAKQTRVQDRATHAVHLVERGRCPSCATRWAERGLYRKCAACGHVLMSDSRFAQLYTETVRSRLPKVLGICALVGLVPVLGMLVCMVYSRLTLTAPFRRHLPRLQSAGTRFGLRIVAALLILAQVLPGVGLVAVPLLAYIQYRTYGWLFDRQLAGGRRPEVAATETGTVEDDLALDAGK